MRPRPRFSGFHSNELIGESFINNLEVNDQVPYARMENIKQST
jgi:hypothetical protein